MCAKRYCENEERNNQLFWRPFVRQTASRFGSVNGPIVFDGSVTPPFGHCPDEPIRLTVNDGVIEKVEGGEDAKTYEKWLE